jgi:phosphoribosyl 1,2-cyclic phosphate phosphodiesterase
MRVTLLGTGTSYGVPVIGCDCAVCTSDDPRNTRMRSSAFIEVDGRSFLIDTTPELRLQALRQGIRRVDAVLYTHEHADHVNGLDDLKAFNAVLGGPLPCFGNRRTESSLRQRFDFAFAGTPFIGAIPHITFEVVDAPFEVLGVTVVPIELQHGRITATGWRIGGAAYLTDTNGIPPRSMALLEGLELLVLDGLRPRPHPTHFSIPEAVDVARALRPRQTLLTHLTHDVDYRAISADLPPGVGLAYDGQIIEVPRS